MAVVKYPIDKVIETNQIKIDNLKIVDTKDTIENKKMRGSIHGHYMNRAIRESTADIVVMMSDDDAVYDTYFSELNDFYSKNLEVMYSYCHITPFDPMGQIPCPTLKHLNNGTSWNTKATSRLNWAVPINPFCKLDATQVSWRISCCKEHKVWLPETQTKNLDASFYQSMFEKFGNCVFNGATGIYKGFHEGQLTNRVGESQYSPTDAEKSPRYLSICSNFKNEQKYLKEWIDYHLKVGVDHFYLYDNNSDDDYASVIKPYYDKGLITLKKVEQTPAKPTVYKDFLENHKFETYWAAFIDCDEFLTINAESESNNLPTLLREYEDNPAVGLNWLMFGSSGKTKNPDLLVVENFTKCNDPYDHSHNNVSCHIKSIINPRKTVPFYINPHFFIYNSVLCYPEPALAVDTGGEYITGHATKKGWRKIFFCCNRSS